MEGDYRAWLEQHDISRPHRTGRWRVRFGDTQSIDLGFIISVGGFKAENPTSKEKEYFKRWTGSEERKHKLNASGYLRYAKYRHLIDGSGEKKTRLVMEMCADIRKAMTCFAIGEKQAGNEAMTKAWGGYMVLLTLANWKLTVKGASFAPGRRKGAKGGFFKLVEDAASRVHGLGWKAVIAELEKNTSLIDEVDWEDEKIWVTGEKRSRKFKTVRNYLSKL